MDARRDVGLVGLGLMGTALSTRLLDAGYTVHGYDPVAAACARFADRGGHVAADAAEVARRCGIVLLSLPNGTVSRSACFDADGVVDGAHDATVVVETSTVLPEEAEAVAADLAARGIAFIDAALSGSSNMVARGDTLGMVGGPPGPVLDRVVAVLRAFCREIVHIGGHGDGMRAKLVVNEVLTLNRFALAEGLVLAESMALDSAQMLRVLQASAAASTAMRMWGPRMVERDYREPNSRMRQHDKDAQLIMATGRAHGAPMLGMSMVNHLVQIGLAHGTADLDNAAIVEVLRDLAGRPPGLDRFTADAQGPASGDGAADEGGREP